MICGTYRERSDSVKKWKKSEKIGMTIVFVIVLIEVIICFVVTADASVLTKRGGVNYYNGHKETWYDLDMTRIVKKAKRIGVPGEYWVSEDGLKMYGDFVIVAADFDVHPYGCVVLTSLGVPGIVLDTGAFTESDPEQIDVAVDWK